MVVSFLCLRRVGNRSGEREWDVSWMRSEEIQLSESQLNGEEGGLLFFALM